MAVDGNRRSCQPGAAQPVRAQGGRPPGLQRFDRVDHDRAVVRPAAARGSGVGQAARVTGAARDQLPARRAGRVLPHDTALLRRAAELPEPVQGPRSGGLLHRVGGHRRDRADLGGAGPPVRQHPVRRGRNRSAVLPGRRRRAGRGGGVGSRTGPDGHRTRRDRLDHRPEPAIPGPGRARHRRTTVAGHVRRRWLAGADRQIRTRPGTAPGAARRRRPARQDRRDGQPGISAVAALHSRPAARPAARRRTRRRYHNDPAQQHHRRATACGHPQSGRPRPRRAQRRVRRDRRHPADGHLRLHHQGLRPGQRGPPAEPLRAAHRGRTHPARAPGQRRPPPPVAEIPDRLR